MGAAVSLPGDWLLPGLTNAIRHAPDEIISEIRSLHGNPARLRARTSFGAVGDVTAWGSADVAGAQAAAAVARALAGNRCTLGTAIIDALPRTAPTDAQLQARALVRADMPSPVIQSTAAPAIVTIGPVGLPASWWWVWYRTRYLAGGGDPSLVDARIRQHVVHLDLQGAYANALATLPIQALSGWRVDPAATGGDVTGTLITPGGACWGRWPDGRLQDGIGRILDVAREAGGSGGFRAAGRVLFGILYGSTVRHVWRRRGTSTGWGGELAAWVHTEQAQDLAPWAAPEICADVISSVTAAVYDAADLVSRCDAAPLVLGLDTDGLIVATVASGADVLSWLDPSMPWRVKWQLDRQGQGIVIHRARQYVASGPRVAWAGLPGTSEEWAMLADAAQSVDAQAARIFP